MMRFLIITFISLLGACQPGGEGTVAVMLNKGQLEIEPGGPNDGYDYKLTFPNLLDVSYNYDNRADREQLVAGALRENCMSVRILDERRTAIGSPLGREIATYTVFAECLPA